MNIPLTEKQFQDQVTDLASRLGWAWLHIERMGNDQGRWRTPVSGPLGRGFPDLMLTRRSSLVFAELKAEGKTATEQQRTLLRILSLVTPHCYIWRPSNFPEIVEVLTNA